MAQPDWFIETEHPRRVNSATFWSLAISGVWFVTLATISSTCQNPLQPFMAMQRILYPSVTSIYTVILTVISVWAALAHSCSYSVVRSKPKSLSSIMYSVFQPQVMLSLVISAFQGLVSSLCFIRVAWPALTVDERFLVGAGAFAGAWMGFNYCFQSANTLQFPVIHKERSYQVQELLSTKVLTKAMFQSFKILQYYFVGSLTVNLGLYQTLPCGMSVNVALAAFITTTFLLVTNDTKLTTLSLYLTSPLHMHELTHSQLLTNLNSDSPLLRILTFQAISSNAKTDPAIRSYIFSLSQPGGHPTNWRTVSHACLQKLRSVYPKPTTATATAPNLATNFPTKDTTLRRLGGNDMNGTKLQDISLAETPDPQILNMSSSLQKFKSFGAISTNDKMEDMMSMISSVEILSQLVVSSLTEDKFGVVQKDLAEIITTLVRLENEISSLKLGQTSVLKRCLTSSLYKIALTFGQHLNEVSLPSSVQQRMKNYAQFLQT